MCITFFNNITCSLTTSVFVKYNLANILSWFLYPDGMNIIWKLMLLHQSAFYLYSNVVMFTHCFLVILLFEVRCWQVTVNSPPGTEYALNKRYPNIVCALFFWVLIQHCTIHHFNSFWGNVVNLFIKWERVLSVH